MLKKIIKYSLLAILISNSTLYALNPLDMLEDGKRAFDLANWEESIEILERFMETWPEHEKYSEALYFYTIASARSIDSRTEAYKTSIGKELEASIASLSLDLPDMDTGEAKAALMIAQNPNQKELWKNLKKLTPSELKHYITRGWYPDPKSEPFETLDWTKSKLVNSIDLDSETKASIELIKLSALWKIMLSPMVAAVSEEKLKKVNCFPLDKTFKNSLQEAFKNGNPDQKRKTAILGYHFDYFKTNNLSSNKKVKSSWLRYLQLRGISTEDAWCP